MESTRRLDLPLLMAGQAQKEIAHNEALQILDSLVALVVQELPQNQPPGTPAVGSCWLIGDQPVGEWAGKPRQVACYTPGGPRYLQPFEGLGAFVRATSTTATYLNGSWEVGVVRAARFEVAGQQVLGPRAAGVADPEGGSVIDAESRAAIVAILGALRSHGLIAG